MAKRIRFTSTEVRTVLRGFFEGRPESQHVDEYVDEFVHQEGVRAWESFFYTDGVTKGQARAAVLNDFREYVRNRIEE